MADKHQCSANVSPNEPWGVFHQHLCNHNATYLVDGKWYCMTHNPELIAKKKAEESAKWNAEYEARRQRDVQLKELEALTGLRLIDYNEAGVRIGNTFNREELIAIGNLVRNMKEK